MNKAPLLLAAALCLAALKPLSAYAEETAECPGGQCRVPTQLRGTAFEEAKTFVEERDPGAIPATGDCPTGKCRRQTVARGGAAQSASPPVEPGAIVPNGVKPPPNPFLKDYGGTIAGGAGGLLLGLGVGAVLAAIGFAGPVVAVAAVCGLVLGLVVGHKFLGGLFG